MSENCNQSCSSCSEDCAERKEQKTDFSEKLHEMSSVKKVIGVVSGKGGVGKSLVNLYACSYHEQDELSYCDS